MRPPLTQAEVEAAQEAAALLSEEEYRALHGAPPADACDCCSCNASRNHPCYDDDECVCFDDPDFEPCDPRVMCEHCGTCYCSAMD